MEEAGENFVIYLNLSSLDGWENKSCQPELGKFAEKPSD
jgi:hypothetical protein